MVKFCRAGGSDAHTSSFLFKVFYRNSDRKPQYMSASYTKTITDFRKKKREKRKKKEKKKKKRRMYILKDAYPSFYMHHFSYTSELLFLHVKVHCVQIPT